MPASRTTRPQAPRRPGRQATRVTGPRRHGPARGTIAGAAGLIAVAAMLLAAAGASAGRAGTGTTLDLRVVAASNRPADQAVKLQVRDAVLALLAPGLADAGSRAAAEALVRRRLGDVRSVAALLAQRSGETVTVRLGPEPLPARRIGIVAFPAGTAPALVVTLGTGLGHNWWTVLFPPLAFVTVRGDLLVVGPGGAPEPVRDLSTAQRRALLDWVAGRTHVALDDHVALADPSSSAGAEVQVRFAVWDLLRSIPWGALRDEMLGWVGAGDGGAVGGGGGTA